VHVAPGGEHDGPQAKHLIDAQPADRRPERILGDTAYGSGPVRAELTERDVEVLAPVPGGRVDEDLFSKHDFRFDLDTGTVSCPGGHSAQISVSAVGNRTATFSTKVRGVCPLKARCCPGYGARKLKIGAHEELLLAARRALADPGSAEHLRRDRPRIERLLGLLAYRYGARKSRYIGSAKARLQAAWAAALVNLNPIGHYLALHNS
jgi:hypothetical protein